MKTVSILRVCVAALVALSAFFYLDLQYPPFTTIAGVILLIGALTLALGYKVNLTFFVIFMTVCTTAGWLKFMEGVSLIDNLYIFVPLTAIVPLALRHWDDFTLDKKIEQRKIVNMAKKIQEQQRAIQEQLLK